MDTHALMKELALKTPSKIVLLVLDGVGGLPDPQSGRTELESAQKPNLDRLAKESVCGLMDPVAPGITPGSGPGHLALFGYDPVDSLVGRGILSALGLNFPIGRNDVASRINFATVDGQCLVTDRRAGRISTEFNRQLVAELKSKISIPGVEVFLETEAGHRAMVVFRAEGLSDQLTDTDPQALGVPPLTVKATAPEAQRAADVVNEFIRQAGEILKDKHPANFLLLRGFAKHPSMQQFPDIYKMSSAAIAAYPMYRGLGRLVGMDVLETGATFADEVTTLEENWSKYDFFFIHMKYTDSNGEDGNFGGKVAAIEEVDRQLPRILALHPDVIAVTADHSTPALLKAHSWHPVPVILGSKFGIPDEVDHFAERACSRGYLGRMHSKELMQLLMGYAQKLQKFGA